MKKALLAALALAACNAGPHLGTASYADLGAGPDGYDFGTVLIGQSSAPQPLKVTATLGTSYTVSSIDSMCPDFALDLSGYTLPFDVSTTDDGMGNITAIEIDAPVTFTPSTAGVESCVFTVVAADGTMVSATFTGTGMAPQQHITLVTPTNQMLEFGEVPVGTPSSPQTVTVRNDGSAPLNISNAYLVNGDAAFAAAGATTGTLSPGETQDWTITCTPPDATDHTDNFEIDSDDPNQDYINIGLHCLGVVTSLDVTPAPVVFDETLVGGSSTQSLTLTNSGTTTLTFTGISASPAAFVPDTSLQGTTLAPGSTAMMNVTFTPDQDGDLPGQLTIATDQTTRNIALTGRGRVGLLNLTPDGTVPFGSVCVGASNTITFSARNLGSGTFALTTATPSAGFTVGSATPSGTLAPGAPPATFDVTFTPTAAGPVAGTVTLNTSLPGAGATHTVNVTGTGFTSGVAADPPSHDFGPLAPGDTSAAQVVTLTNCSGAAITLSTVSLTGADAGDFLLLGGTPTSNVTIAANGSQSWSVVFSPHDGGARHATLAFPYGGGEVDVDLTGQGATIAGTKDRGSYLACSTGAPTSVAPVALALLAVFRRRRR